MRGVPRERVCSRFFLNGEKREEKLSHGFSVSFHALPDSGDPGLPQLAIPPVRAENGRDGRPQKSSPRKYLFERSTIRK